MITREAPSSLTRSELRRDGGGLLRSHGEKRIAAHLSAKTPISRGVEKEPVGETRHRPK